MEKIRRPWERGEGEGGGDGGNMVFKNKKICRILNIIIKSKLKPYYDQPVYGPNSDVILRRRNPHASVILNNG
jgi:hypothetical protein